MSKTASRNKSTQVQPGRVMLVTNGKKHMVDEMDYLRQYGRVADDGALFNYVTDRPKNQLVRYGRRAA
jgi:hypothetical protein